MVIGDFRAGFKISLSIQIVCFSKISLHCIVTGSSWIEPGPRASAPHLTDRVLTGAIRVAVMCVRLSFIDGLCHCRYALYKYLCDDFAPIFIPAHLTQDKGACG